MKRFVYFGLYVLLFSCFAANAWSETMYIRTIVRITLRTGAGIDHKIIRMIKSGQEVEVLDKGKEWSRVQVAEGQIGWVMTNLLTSERPQRFIPGDPESAGEIAGEQQIDLLNRNRTLIAENRRLTTELSESQSALETLKTSFDAYRVASEDYEKLKSEHEKAAALLTKETEKTKHFEGVIADFQFQHIIRWFLAGAGVLIVGFIIGYSVKRQRRRSILR